MYYGQSDIELLRLAGWCKNLPADLSDMFSSQVSGLPVFGPSGIKFLVQLGLINVTKGGQSIRLRDKGWRFLKSIGHEYHRDATYKSALQERRVEIARILLTFWRAGYDVFSGSLDDFEASQVFLSSMAARREKATDVWGGAVFRGLARLSDSICACYYVPDSQEQQLNYKGERFTLDKAALRFGLGGSMLLAGSDYLRLARAVRNNTATKTTEKEAELTLPQIRDTANHPLYLLECGDIGALQLRIMGEQNYRNRLAAVIFQTPDIATRPSAAPIGVTSADGMLVGLGPWIVAVDMDVCRIDRAYRQTLTAGHEKLLIICLEEQKAALTELYEEAHTRIIAVKDTYLLHAFGALPLYEPPADVYIDWKGGMIDAAHLTVD